MAALRHIVHFAAALATASSIQHNPGSKVPQETIHKRTVLQSPHLSLPFPCPTSADNKKSRNALESPNGSEVCTFTQTGDSNYADQPWYHCYTCGLVDHEGCCAVCARVCHAGHDVVFSRKSRFFCDCGAGAAKGRGKCVALVQAPGEASPVADGVVWYHRRPMTTAVSHKLLPFMIDDLYDDKPASLDQMLLSIAPAFGSNPPADVFIQQLKTYVGVTEPVVAPAEQPEPSASASSRLFTRGEGMSATAMDMFGDLARLLESVAGSLAGQSNAAEPKTPKPVVSNERTSLVPLEVPCSLQIRLLLALQLPERVSIDRAYRSHNVFEVMCSNVASLSAGLSENAALVRPYSWMPSLCDVAGECALEPSNDIVSLYASCTLRMNETDDAKPKKKKKDAPTMTPSRMTGGPAGLLAILDTGGVAVMHAMTFTSLGPPLEAWSSVDPLLGNITGVSDIRSRRIVASFNQPGVYAIYGDDRINVITISLPWKQTSWPHTTSVTESPLTHLELSQCRLKHSIEIDHEDARICDVWWVESNLCAIYDDGARVYSPDTFQPVLFFMQMEQKRMVDLHLVQRKSKEWHYIAVFDDGTMYAGVVVENGVQCETVVLSEPISITGVFVPESCLSQIVWETNEITGGFEATIWQSRGESVVKCKLNSVEQAALFTDFVEVSRDGAACRLPAVSRWIRPRRLNNIVAVTFSSLPGEFTSVMRTTACPMPVGILHLDNGLGSGKSSGKASLQLLSSVKRAINIDSICWISHCGLAVPPKPRRQVLFFDEVEALAVMIDNTCIQSYEVTRATSAACNARIKLEDVDKDPWNCCGSWQLKPQEIDQRLLCTCEACCSQTGGPLSLSNKTDQRWDGSCEWEQACAFFGICTTPCSRDHPQSAGVLKVITDSMRLITESSIVTTDTSSMPSMPPSQSTIGSPRGQCPSISPVATPSAIALRRTRSQRNLFSPDTSTVAGQSPLLSNITSSPVFTRLAPPPAPPPPPQGRVRVLRRTPADVGVEVTGANEPWVKRCKEVAVTKRPLTTPRITENPRFFEEANILFINDAIAFTGPMSGINDLNKRLTPTGPPVTANAPGLIEVTVQLKKTVPLVMRGIVIHVGM